MAKEVAQARIAVVGAGLMGTASRRFSRWPATT